ECMIHRTAIIERVKDLIRTKGAFESLGLKMLQHGLLRDVPQPDDFDAWLPAVMIDVSRTIYRDPAAETYPSVVTHQVHEVNVYYARRYPADEVTKEEDERGLAELVAIFENLTWQDRLAEIHDINMVGALITEIDYRPAEFGMTEEMLSDLSVTAIRAQIELITLG
ncbi:unnamed protein product, partial [marine sediment metagenome]